MLAPVDSDPHNADEGWSTQPMDDPHRLGLDRSDFERLVEEYADRVYNVAIRITGHVADAEDAAQEAFLNAFRSWATFRGDSSRGTWLYRIAVNAALARVRQREMVDYLSDTGEAVEYPDWSPSVADVVQRTELRHVVLNGLSLLEPEHRAVIVLRDIDGLSTAEAASILEISEAALKSRLHRARLLLRAYLSEYLSDH